jgi:hypothetical protein
VRSPLPIDDSERYFLRYDEAAEFVNMVAGAVVSTNLIRRWVRDGVPSYEKPSYRYYLQARRINRAIVIHKEDLLSFISQPDINIEAGRDE